MSPMKEYTCRVVIEYAGNREKAEDKGDYVERIKHIFKEEFDLDLDDSEIKDIREVEEESFQISTMEIPRPLNPDSLREDEQRKKVEEFLEWEKKEALTAEKWKEAARKRAETIKKRWGNTCPDCKGVKTIKSAKRCRMCQEKKEASWFRKNFPQFNKKTGKQEKVEENDN